jgi:hypothetical protein
MSGSQASCKRCGNRHYIEDMHEAENSFFCDDCAKEILKISASIREIVFAGPEVRALVEALEACMEQIRHDNQGEAEYRAVDAGGDPRSFTAYMPVAWLMAGRALAPFEEYAK